MGSAEREREGWGEQRERKRDKGAQSEGERERVSEGVRKITILNTKMRVWVPFLL